jgi:hypothetical protein
MCTMNRLYCAVTSCIALIFILLNSKIPLFHRFIFDNCRLYVLLFIILIPEMFQQPSSKLINIRQVQDLHLIPVCKGFSKAHCDDNCELRTVEPISPNWVRRAWQFCCAGILFHKVIPLIVLYVGGQSGKVQRWGLHCYMYMYTILLSENTL